MFIFDTDAIMHDQNAPPALRAKVNSIPRVQLFTTSVTVEEQLQGRLAYTNKYRHAPGKAAPGHVALIQTIYYLARGTFSLFMKPLTPFFASCAPNVSVSVVKTYVLLPLPSS